MIVLLLILVFASTANAQTIFFHESFDDINFGDRGWYDNTLLTIDRNVHMTGSSGSVRYDYEQGTRAADGAIRRLFPESDEVYISYWVKYSDNWEGSNKPYHPHEFNILTNLNSIWHGPAFSHLTLYIEQNEGHPMLGIQDGQNIDQTQVNVDLSSVTEERAVAGCNGNLDGYDDDCYLNGNVYVNGKMWRSSKQWFSDIPGPEYKGDWHHIEAYFKLNSIEQGIGIPNGITRYWYDGISVIDHNDVLLRTGQYPDMKFNQFLIAPYIGDGSPVGQSMWIDELTVASTRPISNVTNKGHSSLQFMIYDGKLVLSATDLLQADLFRDLSLTLHDVLGRSVYSTSRSSIRSDKSILFDLTSVSDGCYYALLRDKTGIATSRKVIIAR